MIRTSLIFLLLGISSIGFAQRPQGGGDPSQFVMGKVLTSADEAIPYANVALYNSDSSLITGTSSTELGMFRIKAEPGEYYLVISFLSYKEQIIPTFTKTADKPHRIGGIQLKENMELLDQVVIEGERSSMELQLDKRVFNVGKDLANTGRSAADILTNVPSVEVDVEGNVSLRGSENVRLLIDGKPSTLTSGGSAEALRMLQGNLIEKVEVITNPSSRYEAQGEVGIINLVLKKQEKQGLNGAFEVRAGIPTSYGASFNLNYRQKWINLFGSYGVNVRRNPGGGYSYNDFDGPDTTFYYDNTRTHVRGGLGHTGRFGADFYLGERNTLTLAGVASLRNNDNKGNIIYQDLNPSNEILNTTERDEKETEVSEDFELNVNHKITFKKKGHEWSTSVRVSSSDDTENANLEQLSSIVSEDGVLQRSSNTEDERNIIAKSDYIQPVGKDGKFETGVRGSIREIENFYSVDIDSVGSWENLDDFTNQLEYLENIYAAYGMFSNKFKKLSYQFGLRVEYTNIETRLIKTNDYNPREYLNLFPSAFLSYELKENHNWQINYSRRISRPHFRNLIPFFGYTDPRNFYSGNPDLNPQFTHSFETGYLHNFEKGNILASLYYRYTEGVVERITITDSSGLLRRFPINLSTQNAIGLELNGAYDLTKWWRFTGSVNLVRQIVEGQYRGKDYNSDGFSAQFRISNMIKLPQKVSLQASMRYRAPSPSTQGTTLSRHSIDLALSRDFLKGNATFTASVSDLTNNQKWRSIIDTEYLYSESDFQWRSRQILGTFTYRLNQKKQRSHSREGMGDGMDM